MANMYINIKALTSLISFLARFYNSLKMRTGIDLQIKTKKNYQFFSSVFPIEINLFFASKQLHVMKKKITVNEKKTCFCFCCCCCCVYSEENLHHLIIDNERFVGGSFKINFAERVIKELQALK